jgi:NAD-dependent deacetylase
MMPEASTHSAPSDNPEALATAAMLIRQSANTVALSGAGISTPSGIPDFRSTAHAVWGRRDPLEASSMTGFRRQPAVFFEWALPLAHQVQRAQPNAAHYALASLEAAGRLRAVITQNVDLLHTRAGSREIYELHGNFSRATCMHCFTEYPTETFLGAYLDHGQMPHCARCGGVLKPNVTLFGEALPAQAVQCAIRATERCALMIVIGSSLVVAPACNLPLLAVRHGAKLIMINQDPTPIDDQATLIIRGDVVDILPQIVAMALNPVP